MQNLEIKKTVIRLNTKELMKAQIDLEIKTDADLAAKMGLSPSQISRAKLNPKDDRYSAPGNHFIASVLAVFQEPFEKFFYLENVEK